MKKEKQLYVVEREKYETEYAFLRAQINPHFLNNTLNLFYANFLPISTDLANGILKLSEIMQYSLEINKYDYTALINGEITHIKNVIDINQLRFNDKLQINFSVNGNTDEVRIIPLVLITIVENILKHGNCIDKLNPVKIVLNINEANNLIYLNTYNIKKNGPKELSSGIGMNNIKQRLKHHYGTMFSLEIHETDTYYSIELELPIAIQKIKTKENLSLIHYLA